MTLQACLCKPNSALRAFALLCTAMHCFAIHCYALRCYALLCIAMHCYAWHFYSLLCIALHCSALRRHELICIAVFCILLRWLVRTLRQILMGEKRLGLFLGAHFPSGGFHQASASFCKPPPDTLLPRASAGFHQLPPKMMCVGTCHPRGPSDGYLKWGFWPSRRVVISTGCARGIALDTRRLMACRIW